QTMGELANALKGYLAYRREGSLADSAVKAPVFPRVSSPVLLESVEPAEPAQLEYDLEVAPKRRGRAVLGALAMLLALGAAGLYVAVADRAGMIHVRADGLSRWVPPPLAEDALPPVELDSDGDVSALFPRGVIGQKASKGRVLRAEPEIEREDVADE